MKKFLALLILAGLSYGGYLYYQSTRIAVSPPYIQDESGDLVISQGSNKIGNLAAVLGASISNIVSSGQEYLSDVTGGASQPVINQLVTKTQEALQELPKKEAERIKYEFCKDVVTEYEK